ncbi:preprotein translocase subunit SecE, partial [Achromatium sp. WMS2]
RVLSLLAIAGISTALAYNTELGRGVWALVYDSRMEVRKIVWPTQEETTQTTIVVFVMVIVMSLLLWAFDALLMMIVRYLTGQGS